MQEACDALLPLPPMEGPHNLTGRLCSLRVHVPRVIRCTIHHGASAALTLARLQLPQVDLGAMALGVLEDTSDRALEEAKDTVAPLIAVAVNIIDDWSLLVDEHPDEGGTPTDPLASP